MNDQTSSGFGLRIPSAWLIEGNEEFAHCLTRVLTELQAFKDSQKPKGSRLVEGFFWLPCVG